MRPESSGSARSLGLWQLPCTIVNILKSAYPEPRKILSGRTQSCQPESQPAKPSEASIEDRNLMESETQGRVEARRDDTINLASDY